METDLIRAWKLGDQVAAEAIYDAHRVRIFRLAYALLGNKADAEEVMQDTMLYAFTNIGRFDEERAAFKTWLHTICVSRCRNLQRRKRLSLTALSTWVRELKNGPAISAEITSTNHTILQAVQILPPKQREAVILRFWADHSFEELSKRARFER